MEATATCPREATLGRGGPGLAKTEMYVVVCSCMYTAGSRVGGGRTVEHRCPADFKVLYVTAVLFCMMSVCVCVHGHY